MSDSGHKNGPSTSRGSSAHNNSSSSSSTDYTKEDVEAVRKIVNCKDLYEILGVSKEASESELKKQYRKLALQFHPDKNKTPGTAEAFKKINNSFAVLSDPDKKRKYDTYGNEEPSLRHRHTRNSYYTDEYFEYTRGYGGDDMTAEELFNMFFGGGNVYMRRNTRTHQRTASPQQEPSAYGVFVHILPILILVIFSMMSSFFVSDPAYSLQKTAKYNVQRYTSNLEIPYYVKKDFLDEYSHNLQKVEHYVEDEYINHLRQQCYREKSYRDSLIWRSRATGDGDLLKRAQELKMPNCAEISKLQAKIYVY